MGDRVPAGAQRSGIALGVEPFTLIVGDHAPETVELVGGNPQSELGQVPFEIGADESSLHCRLSDD